MNKKIDHYLEQISVAKVGGGLNRIESQHKKGKLTARERIERMTSISISKATNALLHF